VSHPLRAVVLAVLAAAMMVSAAAAVEPDEILADPALEARAREIGKELRCLVCQNQSIDDSDAELARDLRVVVRERLTAGDGDQEVIDYVVSRYGDFVLLKPPFKLSTYALWLGPGVIAIVAILALVAFYRRRSRTAGRDAAAPLSESESKTLAALLEDDRR
jgi:cytochrome c-type biogenesis protein CcmH